MEAYGAAAGALAPDGDFVRVAAEGGDVLLDPAEREMLVEEGVVGEASAGDLGGV